jgi:uncharacterized protein (DUF1800 family)
MRLHRFLTAPLCLALAAAVLGAQSAERPFGPEEAEHLLNRAGFGGPPEEIARLVRLGRAAAVDDLIATALRVEAARTPFEIRDWRSDVRRDLRAKGKTLNDEQRREATRVARQEDGAQLLAYRERWIASMIDSPSPLFDKLCLFWAGHFTSSQKDVRNSAHMIRQHETVRRNAFGSFRTMLHEVARDPAMLAYLDNDDNKKHAPNENFAREVMELFTLGLGNYTEDDVREAARAFTGWRADDGRFALNARQHDFGNKKVLGRVGRWNGDDVLELLLEHPAAPRFVAGRILGFFVAPDPPAALVDRYARLLRENRWALEPVFRALFNDPEFYSPEFRGNRILGPVEFGAALARKLPAPRPPARLVSYAADSLGQSLFAPPNVKGWEGGEAWITTSAMLVRGNLALAMVEGLDAVRDNGFRRPAGDLYGRAEPVAWKSKLDVGALLEAAGVATPEQAVDALCDRFLSVPVSVEARRTLIDYATAGCSEGNFVVRGPVANRAHLRLLHLILSLPEAQLG